MLKNWDIYIVKPICEYTFDRMKTPFNEYINSLYGRFGINPNSSLREIVDEIEARNLSIKYETSDNEQ